MCISNASPGSCVGVVFCNGVLPSVCREQSIVLATGWVVWRFPWDSYLKHQGSRGQGKMASGDAREKKLACVLCLKTRHWVFPEPTSAV